MATRISKQSRKMLIRKFMNITGGDGFPHRCHHKNKGNNKSGNVRKKKLDKIKEQEHKEDIKKVMHIEKSTKVAK